MGVGHWLHHYIKPHASLSEYWCSWVDLHLPCQYRLIPYVRQGSVLRGEARFFCTVRVESPFKNKKSMVWIGWLFFSVSFVTHVTVLPAVEAMMGDSHLVHWHESDDSHLVDCIHPLDTWRWCEGNTFTLKAIFKYIYIYIFLSLVFHLWMSNCKVIGKEIIQNVGIMIFTPSPQLRNSRVNCLLHSFIVHVLYA